MYTNILVPTDLAEKSELSIEAALGLAAQNQGKVQLLHVVEKVGGESDAEIEDFYLKLAEDADHTLRDWRQRFQADFMDVPIEIAIVVGKRAQEILRFVDEKGIDLIVMTSRTFNREEGELGTLSHQISLFAPVSVFVVR